MADAWRMEKRSRGKATSRVGRVHFATSDLTARAQDSRLYRVSEDINAVLGSAGVVKVPAPGEGTSICTSNWPDGVRLWKNRGGRRKAGDQR